MAAPHSRDEPMDYECIDDIARAKPSERQGCRASAAAHRALPHRELGTSRVLGRGRGRLVLVLDHASTPFGTAALGYIIREGSPA